MSSSREIDPQALLIVLSAPSGAGKTTLCDRLLARNPNMIRAITCTTRAPREGEKDGADYYFLEAQVFLKRVQTGDFLEHAIVHGNSYGTLKSEVLDKLRTGQDVLLNVDVQGAATIRARAQEEPALGKALVTIFLAPPSLAELERRLRQRDKDAPSVMLKRLSAARQEIAQAKNYEYLLTSATIDDDVRRAEAIIEVEKMRQFRTRLPAYDDLPNLTAKGEE